MYKDFERPFEECDLPNVEGWDFLPISNDLYLKLG